MPLLLVAGAVPGGILSVLLVLFVFLTLLAPGGGRAGEGQGVSRPGRVWRVVYF